MRTKHATERLFKSLGEHFTTCPQGYPMILFQVKTKQSFSLYIDHRLKPFNSLCRGPDSDA